MTTTPPELVADEPWQRLDPRMLLVYPIRELVRFLPVLVGLFVAGQASGGSEAPWQLLGVAVPVVLGLLRYLTTSFRITADRIELRRGLLNKHLLSTRLERVRTVDVSASPIQRLLGLTTVRVGTGTASTSGEDRVDLDGLPAERSRQLRAELLHAGPRTAEDEPEAGEPPRVREVLRLDPAWARFAPLTSTGVVTAAAVLGVGSQVLEGLGGPSFELEEALPRFDGSWWLAALAAIAIVVVFVSMLAVAGYLVANWGFTLAHAAGARSWHLRRGLFTTRETSLDEERLSGVSIGEPIGLRLAGGGRLSAIVTGLDRSQSGSSMLVPPAPRVVVAGVAGEVLGTHEPVTTALRSHGPRARVRRYTRALVPAVLVAIALVLVVAAGAPAWVLVPAMAVPVAAVLLAMDRTRSLGHALTSGHFVARSGSLLRQRQALTRPAIIGWNFRATWFQRRAGLTTLQATTAGGSQSVTALDVPEPDAVAVSTTAVPGLVDQFLAPPD